ncbi:MerR family transcriptional regulator [Undibacterium danionis]|uniref:MerR family transcriptional regulator n=1 Tax=Undibacterium danionis TaxID=1812100 RepID=A0ABV6IH28_9BURK
MNNQTVKSAANEANATYRSGAAARLSGVPVETLRVWERRYGVTDPSRSERGQRQYSFEDVRRLGLIKQLVDAGNSIGAVAHLDLQQLLAMLSAVANLPAAQSQVQLSNGMLRIALVGVMLRQSLINLDPEQSKLSLVQTAFNLKQAPMQLKDVKVDVMVVEQGELTAPEEQIPLLGSAQQACQATAVLILYRFASSDAIRQLRLAGFHVARIPSDMLEIDHLCRVAMARALTLVEQQGRMGRVKKNGARPADAARNKKSNVIPARLLDDEHLTHIAKFATSIHCECPRHLVDLLQMLTSFERYSAQCENRNEDDASLHRDLHYTAAHARSALEQALVRVAQAEGIQY